MKLSQQDKQTMQNNTKQETHVLFHRLKLLWESASIFTLTKAITSVSLWSAHYQIILNKK